MIALALLTVALFVALFVVVATWRHRTYQATDWVYEPSWLDRGGNVIRHGALWRAPRRDRTDTIHWWRFDSWSFGLSRSGREWTIWLGPWALDWAVGLGENPMDRAVATVRFFMEGGDHPPFTFLGPQLRGGAGLRIALRRYAEEWR